MEKNKGNQNHSDDSFVEVISYVKNGMLFTTMHAPVERSLGGAQRKS